MSDQLTFVDYLQRVKSGLETWKEKPHNAKWWKRIDGTPIPNDLCVCIAEALARPPSTSKRATPRTLTDHQREIEEAAGMPLDWNMAAGFVAGAAQPSEPPAPDALRTWIAGAQFMVTPKEAPDGNAPLHVVTVEGLLKWLDEREIAPHHRWPSVRNKADTAVLRDTKEQG